MYAGLVIDGPEKGKIYTCDSDTFVLDWIDSQAPIPEYKHKVIANNSFWVLAGGLNQTDEDIIRELVLMVLIR